MGMGCILPLFYSPIGVLYEGEFLLLLFVFPSLPFVYRQWPGVFKVYVVLWTMIPREETLATGPVLVRLLILSRQGTITKEVGDQKSQELTWEVWSGGLL